MDLRFGDEPTDGHDVILGTAGPDRIRAGGGDDTVCGLGGRDRIIGGAGDDWIAGGGARDVLVGGPGRDRLIGGGGPDRLVGGSGRDRLFGNRGSDVLRGGPGNDWLIGASGRNRCDGGAGRDRLGPWMLTRRATDAGRLVGVGESASRQGRRIADGTVPPGFVVAAQRSWRRLSSRDGRSFSQRRHPEPRRGRSRVHRDRPLERAVRRGRRARPAPGHHRRERRLLAVPVPARPRRAVERGPGGLRPGSPRCIARDRRSEQLDGRGRRRGPVPVDPPGDGAHGHVAAGVGDTAARPQDPAVVPGVGRHRARRGRRPRRRPRRRRHPRRRGRRDRARRDRRRSGRPLDPHRDHRARHQPAVP